MNRAATQTDLRTRLRELRKAKGWTLAEVANHLGTTAQTISRLETNVMTVSTDWLQRFADLYNVSAAELIDEAPRAAVTVIGHVSADGQISNHMTAPLPVPVTLAGGIAVKLDTAQGPFGPNSYLVATRLEGRNLSSANGKACIVQCTNGPMRLGKLINGMNDKFTLVPLGKGDVLYDQVVEWAAAVKFEIKLAE